MARTLAAVWVIIVVLSLSAPCAAEPSLPSSGDATIGDSELDSLAEQSSTGIRVVHLNFLDDELQSVLLDTTGGSPNATAACPVNCTGVTEWCNTMFTRNGGTLVGRNCDSTGFECACNSVAVVRVTQEDDGDDGDSPTCSWPVAGFANTPSPNTCLGITGTCPTSCVQVRNSWFPAYCANSTNTYCTESASDGGTSTSTPSTTVIAGCTTCAGGTYTVQTTGGTCTNTYTNVPTTCDPVTTCSGHGCCSQPSSTAASTCNCFRSAAQGYWDGARCDQCQSAYETRQDSNVQCASPKSTLQVLLSSIANPWSLILPNLVIVFLFVVFSVFRCRWESDETFDQTRLLRANLSNVQVSRRNQDGLFHSKYIPKRPVKSKCFVNNMASKKPQRGVPPY